MSRDLELLEHLGLEVTNERLKAVQADVKHSVNLGEGGVTPRDRLGNLVEENLEIVDGRVSAGVTDQVNSLCDQS